MNFFKNYIETRAAWLDANIPGVCNLSTHETETIDFELFPNPTESVLNFIIPLTDFEIRIYDAMGNYVTGAKNVKSLDVSFLANGIYFLSLQSPNKLQTTRRFIKQ